ncbi:protein DETOXIFICATION 55 [Apium graveolens]|uniref:protein DETOXIFICATION 55 n=1 Tax=Apium graveolens TaxID=4045 RepID=UPI003D7B13C9
MAPHDDKQLTLPEVMEELKKISSIGFPILAMGLVNYVRNMISVVCMGRLGSIELAGGALAIGFTNITGYSVLSGLAMGMEPLCSQAFGSRNLTIASLTLHRTIFMLLFASIPIAFLWLNLEPLMLLLHQNLEITKIASLYCFYAIPDLVANSFLQPLRIYLRSKGTTRPFMWCTSLATILHLPITIFLTFNLNLGVKGIALSIIITNFISLIFLVSYMFCTRSTVAPPLSTPLLPRTSNSSPQGEDWGILLRLAIPSCLAVCLEWWWYELMTLAAGYLQNPEAALATSAIVIQTTSLLYTLPSALSASVSTRVGNELGAGRPRQASLSSTVAIGLALLSSTMGLLWTTIGRKSWGNVFTEDTEVLELTMAALPIIGLCEIANCPQTTCCGVLRGSARPSAGAGINFYSFYLVGAPVAIALAFVWKLEFLGLCYGLLAAQVSCVLAILTVIYKTDWEEESLKARHLVGGHGEYFTYTEIIKSQQSA